MSTSSRDVAVGVAAAVEAGAFADVALHDGLREAGLSGPAAARATAIAFGAIRLRNRCDLVLRELVHRPLDELDPPVRAVLRVGAYELLWAHRTNAPAAVHDLVEITRRRAHDRVAGFANGVLRNLLRQADVFVDPPTGLVEPDRLEDYLVEWESFPRWHVRRWLRRFGPETATALCRQANREPGLHLRVNPLRCDRDRLLAALADAGVEAEPSPVFAQGIRLSATRAIEELPGYDDGWFTIQDEGAMLIAPLCEPAPGQRVLDLCAAPGGKATHLAELMGDRGELLASDRNEARLAWVEASVRRLGLTCLRLRAGDARGLEDQVSPADVVLLDAPCSGTGTLARRPDLRWRLSARRLAQLGALQRELLATAAALTRPGGVMVYATCSLEAEENEQQMGWFDEHQPGFAADSPAEVPPAWDPHRAQALLVPAGTDHDGFFMARRRRAQ